MNDTKQWWQSKIVIAQLVAVVFALAGAFHVLPADVDQAQVVEAIMGLIAFVTLVLRIFSTHRIEAPKGGGGTTAALAIALPLAALMLHGCATIPAVAPSALERADTAYDRLQAVAEGVIPFLPADQQARARAILAALGMALDAAHAATSPAAQNAALHTANTQVAALGAALAR